MTNRNQPTTWLVIVMSFVGPILVALVAGSIGFAAAARGTDAQLIQLSIDILQAPISEQRRPLREWAVETINRYSKVEIDSQSGRLLLDSIRLPRTVVRQGALRACTADGTVCGETPFFFLDTVPSIEARDTILLPRQRP